ncbi:hypothetical protein EYC84_006074 [Monilinia fructicola]|uniref:Potassium transport protein n=1 Tax=Monilinia fructicola TaxID=38448 RepID=A0A5M9K609_MONFR|nr:hypothetical protein EYC84_006074 [Monilinia fructicola]
MTTFQQIILWLLIIVGSAIFVSVATVRTRKRAFEVRFGEVVGRQKEQMRRCRSASRGGAESRRQHGNGSGMGSGVGENINEDAVQLEDGLKNQSVGGKGDEDGITATSEILSHGEVPKDTGDHITFAPVAHPANDKKEKNITIGNSNNQSRNGQIHGLSRNEREHLGGVEYRAISFLAWLVPAYFILWQVLGGIGLGAYMAYNKSNVALENGINPWWLGLFNAISAFNNSGMSLLDSNMIPFQTSIYTLLTMGLLILAGNTAYPLFLRLILYTFFKLLDIFPNSLSRFQHHTPTLRFILRYPRRVYTNLFPSHPTWWLLFMVITLNSIDWAAFELLNIGNPATQVIEPRYRVLDGLFQAIAVRSGGFYIISIPTLRIGLQFLYVVMMYISVYPVVITMRHSNVYEEQSLGIYTSDISPFTPHSGWGLAKKIRRSFSGRDPTPPASKPGSPKHKTGTGSATAKDKPQREETTGTEFIRHQLRSQLSHDLWWLTLAIFLIVCIEVSNFERDPVAYSVFNVIFEVVSAYGCVGISVGLPDQSYSFFGGIEARE